MLNTSPVDEAAKPVFGRIPANADEIVVLVEDAQVTITHVPNQAEITISSNCPRSWNLTRNVVRQAGFAKARAGVSMMGDQLGSRAIVNGKIYVLPTGQVKNLQLGKDGVSVGGQKIDPIPGTEMPGTCEGPDTLTIRVPESYAGTLKLGCSGQSQVSLDKWKGGKLEATLLRESSLSAKSLQALDKTVVDLHGQGKAEIGALSTKVLVANINGGGSISINGSADISNATVMGNGTVKLKGDFKNLQKSVQGTGTIEVVK